MSHHILSAPLKKRSEFQKVYKGGKFFTACFSVHFIKKSMDDARDLSCLEYGITVSKKNCGNAVSRNFIKRRIRESFRLYGVSDDLAAYQIVFTALKRAPQKSWDDYVRAMKKLSFLIQDYDKKV